MGRKSKRMALYEAIRQGQAKIAEGLENGQMRSDGLGQQNAQQLKNAQSATRQRMVGKSALFESQEISRGFTVTPAMIKVVLAGGGILVLVLILWLGSLIFRGSDTIDPAGARQQTGQSGQVELSGTNEEPREPSGAVEKTQEPEPEKKPGIFSFGRKDPEKAEETKEPEKQAEPVYESTIGKNVIVIQSIAESRKEIMEPLKDYFDSKGVPTEIIMNNGDALLVTRQGFDKNPAGPGTEGYKLLQKVKQLGLLYPQETGDTKWGVRPFQEAWGLKRRQ